MKSINPANNKLLKEYRAMDISEVYEIISQMGEATTKWQLQSIQSRCDYIKSVAKNLLANKNQYSELITLEMGKVYRESEAEIDKCLKLCDYYINNAEKYLADETIESRGDGEHESFISYQPLGIILGVMPWNFPFWQVFRFAVPVLLAGNTCVLKHAHNVTGCALALEDIFSAKDYSNNLFKSIIIETEDVHKVIEHELIQGVSLTGSTKAGQSVASKAGDSLKKTVLELGGNDPYIILNDANIDLAVHCCVKSRLINAGQSCIAAKRFIVEEGVYNEFLDLLTDKFRQVKMGNPFDTDTDIGPMASIAHRDALHQQIEKSISMGATCLLGGEIPAMDGAYYPATILINVTQDMPAFDEELFGPVAVVYKVSNEDAAIYLANQSQFGLGAALFTQDIVKGKEIARNKIQSGACFVNDFVASDPVLPFGGIKQSGYGRELSYYGIREFTNVKAIRCYSA